MLDRSTLAARTGMSFGLLMSPLRASTSQISFFNRYLSSSLAVLKSQAFGPSVDVVTSEVLKISNLFVLHLGQWKSLPQHCYKLKYALEQMHKNDAYRSTRARECRVMQSEPVLHHVHLKGVADGVFSPRFPVSYRAVGLSERSCAPSGKHTHGIECRRQKAKILRREATTTCTH